MLYNGEYKVIDTEGREKIFTIKLQPSDSTFAPGMRVVSAITQRGARKYVNGFAFLSGSDDPRVDLWRRKDNEQYRRYARLLESIGRMDIREGQPNSIAAMDGMQFIVNVTEKKDKTNGKENCS